MLFRLGILSPVNHQQAVRLLHLRTLQSSCTRVLFFLSTNRSQQRQQVLVKPTLCANCAAIHTVSRKYLLRHVRGDLKNDCNVSLAGSKQLLLSTGGRLLFSFSLTQKAGEKWQKSTQRAYSTLQPSSLFVSGADDSYQSPVQVKLDLETLLSPQNVEKLRRNLTARGLDFDLDKMVADYKKWQEVDEAKTKLETQRTTISKAMAVLVKDKKSANVEARKEELTRKGKVVKEQLRETMPIWYSVEERIMLQAMKLPANLHPLTPSQDTEEDVVKAAITPEGIKSHITVAEEQQGLLKFSNVGPKAVYLLGELADLEQSLLHHATIALSEKGFSPFAGSEIFRTVVVEGCGVNQRNAEEIFSLHQKEDDHQGINAYHLKGNSLLSYAAFFAKMQVKTGHLPLKFYSMGRHYKPPTDQDYPGLYGAVQSNRVTMFAACASAESATEMHREMVQGAWDIIQGLSLPTRKLQVSAKHLDCSESLCTDLELWAPSLQCYIKMGHVSIHSDYPSGRLLSRVHPDGTPLHMVFGVVMDMAPVLATILEHSVTQGEFELMRLPCLQNKP